MKSLLVGALLALLPLAGCLYRMPTQDNICTSPAIGNPHLNRETPHSFIPGK